MALNAFPECALIAIVLIAFSFYSRHKHCLPPGPAQNFFLGNVLQYPRATQKSWVVFSQWAQTYGDLLYLNLLGRPVILIHSHTIVKDLLYKRAPLYSSRPHLVMAFELAGYNKSFTSMDHSEKWRHQRRLISRGMSPSSIVRFSIIQEDRARRLIHNILEDPSGIQEEVKFQSAGIILRVTYGYQLKSKFDPFYTNALTSMSNFVRACTPGTFMVEVLPFLKYLPEWIPGVSFHQTAKSFRATHDDATWKPFRWAEKCFADGTACVPNLYADIMAIDSQDGTFQADDIAFALMASLGGGLDTNLSTVITFFLAMVLHPEVQDRAFSELESAIGGDRLPTISDQDHLPFVNAILFEVLRWHPAAPLGVPHRLDAEDEYQGYYLPKNSTIIANVWQVQFFSNLQITAHTEISRHMAHDPKVFPNPDVFDPTRYLEKSSNVDRVTEIVFGFGRRTCPGQNFAHATLFAIFSTVLATCRILPAHDNEYNGKHYQDLAFTSQAVSMPEHFQCRLEPRSIGASLLLKAAASVPLI